MPRLFDVLPAHENRIPHHGLDRVVDRLRGLLAQQELPVGRIDLGPVAERHDDEILELPLAAYIPMPRRQAEAVRRSTSNWRGRGSRGSNLLRQARVLLDRRVSCRHFAMRPQPELRSNILGGA